MSTLPISVERARSLYANKGGAHDFDHVLRVFRLAERIGKEENADWRVLGTAALLHDIGESAGRERHHLVGADIAASLLEGEPTAFVAAVRHAIMAHRFRAGPAPETIEARCLSDADKLDAIGAIGVARAFAYAGSHGEPIWTVPIPIVEQQPLPEVPAYTPVHEFVFKLRRIREQLYTDAARKIADERHQFMVDFFRRLDAEVLGLL